MADFRLTVTGSSEEMDALDRCCRELGAATGRSVEVVYEGVALTLFAVQITAGLAVVAQCLATYSGTRKTPLRMTYHVPAKGHLVLENFSPESIANVLRTTDKLHVESNWA